MSNSERFLGMLELVNETLTATIVIIAVSILLYNWSRGTQQRVTRASGYVLLCVIIAYLADVFVALEPGRDYLPVWLRMQWIGIAFVPAALLHLSDALLATTGRPSRGRRRNVVRMSYLISTAFTALVFLSDWVVTGPIGDDITYLKGGPLFLVYIAYLLVIGGFAMINVLRARRRCLTRTTQRRMTYLLSVFLAPVWGTFPYSTFGQWGDSHQTLLMVVINLANLIIMLMLVFMAYPLSFFGSDRPDRVIKSQLLEFMLRGPFTGTAVLAVILFLPRVSNVLGIGGDALIPFGAVAVVLFLQWTITLVLPVLQRWFIYGDDQHRVQWIQRLSDHLLTQADASQLLESVLAALCDYLRIPTAFVATLEGDGAQLVQVVGGLAPSSEALAAPELSALAGAESSYSDSASLRRVDGMFVWRSYWLIPLRFSRPLSDNARGALLGILGLWARAPEPDLRPEEEHVFFRLVRQAALVLEDVQRQGEVFAILEGLASRMDATRELRGISRYGHVSALPSSALPANDVLADPKFPDLVRDALRDYWGGPKLTDSELLKLNVVWREMEEAQDHNPVRALRAVLARAIENLKPEGQRSLTTTEWILYNILEMRFLQGRKVRDVALRLAMSESDLYRKQGIAINQVARQIEEMERGAANDGKEPV